MPTKEAIWNARAKWRDIGRKLGLNDGDIQAIHEYDDGECLHKVLSQWMHTGKATIYDLMAVLESEVIDRPDIARKIRSRKGEDRGKVGLDEEYFGDTASESNSFESIRAVLTLHILLFYFAASEDDPISSMRAALSGEPTFEEVSILPVSEVWYQLGMWLGVKEQVLMKIKHSVQSNKTSCMFEEYLISKQITKNQQNLSAKAKAVLERFFNENFPAQLASLQVMISRLDDFERNIAEELFHQVKKQRETLVLGLVKVGLRDTAKKICESKGLTSCGSFSLFYSVIFILQEYLWLSS